jgi:hypothetical protein
MRQDVKQKEAKEYELRVRKRERVTFSRRDMAPNNQHEKAKTRKGSHHSQEQRAAQHSTTQLNITPHRSSFSHRAHKRHYR